MTITLPSPQKITTATTTASVASDSTAAQLNTTATFIASDAVAAPNNGSLVGGIVGGILATLLLVAMIVAVVVVWRRRNQQRPEQLSKVDLVTAQPTDSDPIDADVAKYRSSFLFTDSERELGRKNAPPTTQYQPINQISDMHDQYESGMLST